MARPGSHFPHNSFPLLFLLEDFSWLLDFSISSIFLILFGSTIGYFLQTSATVTKTFLLLAFWLFLCSHLIFLHLPRLDFWLMACFSLGPPFFCSFLGPRLPFSSAESALPISGICSSHQQSFLSLLLIGGICSSFWQNCFLIGSCLINRCGRPPGIYLLLCSHPWILQFNPESCSSTLNLAVLP